MPDTPASPSHTNGGDTMGEVSNAPTHETVTNGGNGDGEANTNTGMEANGDDSVGGMDSLKTIFMTKEEFHTFDMAIHAKLDTIYNLLKKHDKEVAKGFLQVQKEQV